MTDPYKEQTRRLRELRDGIHQERLRNPVYRLSHEMNEILRFMLLCRRVAGPVVAYGIPRPDDFSQIL